MSEHETKLCEAHGETVALVTKAEAESLGVPYGCQGCRDEMLHGRDPESMTGDERSDEIHNVLSSPCLAGFDAVWKRVDALVGRSTWTHELALPDQLAAEARTRSGATNPEVVVNRLHALMGDKPVIVVGDESA